MKKFLIVCAVLILVYLAGDYLYYTQGVYLQTHSGPPSTSVKTADKMIYLNENSEFREFEIKGVDLGAGIPGHFATDFSITKADYLRWFRWIQEMGANTIRVYTILSDDFYNAVYEYNHNNPNPLYVIHGLWVNDYVQNSHVDAYDTSFLDAFLKDSRTLVDILHGQRRLSLGRGLGSGSYNKDISPWVIGYILGVEWEDVTVAYTDHMQKDRNSYTGTYLYTAPGSSPFEAMLAQVGDRLIEYETKRYGTQRLVAFSNWPTTDPFDYPELVQRQFQKIAKVDTEHIKSTGAFLAGMFASYHIYPYYPDYLNYMDVPLVVDESGTENSYRTYLKMINDHHTMPVIISEFGVPSSRGMAQKDANTKRNQGGMSETEQGEALVSCYRDIKAAGCAGAIIFTWQDEWFKRTWNTMHAADLLKTPYWSDYQTNEQYFGLLSFDPGKEKSVCYVDGDISEWTEKDLLVESEDQKLSVKYDEKFLYLLINQKDLAVSQPLYLPFDITPKTGSTYCQNFNVRFGRAADFVLRLNGKTDTRLLVQERYEVLRAMFSHETESIDAYEYPPAKDTPLFKKIDLILQTPVELTGLTIDRNGRKLSLAEVYETGRLTYGNANPTSAEFNSLADFCISGDYVEIKLPWQLLNFSNPAELTIHDDYYEHYGVENLKIKEFWIGLGTQAQKDHEIELYPVSVKPWGRNPTSHERLKASYYTMQREWTRENP